MIRLMMNLIHTNFDSCYIGSKDTAGDTNGKTQDESSTPPTTSQEFDELLQEFLLCSLAFCIIPCFRRIHHIKNIAH